mmetsp:Transcript_10431/g.29691  ORF Transcript_10431/g.29691 Transcript_10431/m.29691 type:complete len:387 (+) Transcript_10431:51-1211(+)
MQAIGSQSRLLHSLASCTPRGGSVSASLSSGTIRSGGWERARNVTSLNRRVQSGASTGQQVENVQTVQFLPPELEEIIEPAAVAMARRMRRIPVTLPSQSEPLQTACVGPEPSDASRLAETTPVVLLHGFDSSSLEFRRLYPLLEEQTETWAVDLVGWGFTDNAFESKDQALGPIQKREHLYSWWKEYVGRPMVLVGASLGGAVAIDFAHAYPEAVSKIVLVDAQGFIDGIGPMASLPRPLAMLGVSVLKTVPLRQAANKMAYFDKNLYATEDAMRVGRLHTHMPGWADANCAFMQSGGYSILDIIPKVQQQTLILWGRQDEILDPKYATQFLQTLPNAELVWVEQCGHCAHLEQPAFMAKTVLEFIGGAPTSSEIGQGLLPHGIP